MTAARHGGVLGRLLMILVVVSLAGALAWAVLANHRASGSWSFHPLDPAWWSPAPQDPAGGDPFAGVADDAKRLAGKAGESLWGKGGLVERCETWWREHARPAASATAPEAQPPATAPPATAPRASDAPEAPALPAPAPPTVRGMLEQRMAASEQRFAEGVELAKRARPALGDDAAALAGRLGTLTQARACFSDVERDLGEAIPAYEAIPGHDPARLASAKQLLAFTRQMQELTRLTY